MKYCSKCGQSLDDDAVVCVRCGCKVAGNNSVQDHSSFGYGLLGFCIPIAGLILWLVWSLRHRCEQSLQVWVP